MIPRDLVLCYHRVGRPERDPFRLCVSPENFRAHLEILAHRTDVVPIGSIDGDPRGHRVAVTFDDGYADNYEYAMPIAEELGIPITVYVTSGAVGTNDGFWWDRLAALLLREPAERRDVEVRVGETKVTFPFSAPASSGRDLFGIHRVLRMRPVEEIEEVLYHVGSELGLSTAAASDTRALSDEELVKLARATCVTIGAHTADHVLLASRPPEEQYETMVRSKEDLEWKLGQVVEHFAYPFGGHDAVDNDTVRAALRAGFRSGVTTLTRPFVRGAEERLNMPRRLVMDWSAKRFALQLVRWGMI